MFAYHFLNSVHFSIPFLEFLQLGTAAFKQYPGPLQYLVVSVSTCWSQQFYVEVITSSHKNQVSIIKAVYMSSYYISVISLIQTVVKTISWFVVGVFLLVVPE